MYELPTAKYVPIATSRNKLIFNEMRPGIHVAIDVVNTASPWDRAVVQAWTTVEDDEEQQPTIWYHDGPRGPATRFGWASEMKELIAKAKLVV